MIAQKKQFLFLAFAIFLLILGTPLLVPAFSPLVMLCGYALLWRGIDQNSTKKIFSKVFLVTFAIEWVHVSWMRSDIYQGAYTHFFLLFISAFLAFLTATATALAFFRRSSRLWPFYIAAFLTLFEWVRYLPLSGFSWDPISLPFLWNIKSAQFYAIGGTLFVSFFLLLTNAFLFKAWVDKKRLYYIAWVFCAVIPYLWGGLRLQETRNPQSNSINVLVIESYFYPYMGQYLPGQKRPQERLGAILKALPKEQDKKYDLLLIPEGVLPFGQSASLYPFPWISNDHVIEILSKKYHAAVVAGLEVEEEDHSYNAAFFRKGESSSFYAKQILIPIAEKIPFDFLRPLARRYGIIDSFSPGKQNALFPIKEGIQAAPNICYEETFSPLVWAMQNKGAQLLINISNDVWYPDSLLAKEHFLLSRARAIECGLPLVRACNAGISAAFDPYGRILAKRELLSVEEKAAAFSVMIPERSVMTPFKIMGSSIIFFLFVTSGIFYLIELRRSESKLE